MGRYLNPNNNKFQNFLKEKYVVDKSRLLNNILEKMEQNKKFLCCSRPRRFGKSVTAQMLVAYFSRGADSSALFAQLKCVKDETFLNNLNQCDTIFMDIQAQFVKAKDQDANPMKMLQENVVRELEKAYSGLIQGDENLSEALAVINAETGNEFVIIFDEWDYPIRELAEQSRERQDDIEFLRMMFKNADAQDYVRLAYLTGILPMVRAKGQSAVNNFDEYTMIDARDLGGDIGFVEEEVQALCEKSGVSAAEMKYWYDGYDLGGVEVYNPLSVVRAVESGKFRQYWTETGTYEDIRSLIEYDFDGLREAVIQMLSGNRIFVNVYGCKNDMYTFRDKDQVITTLIHLGYFAYDADTREAYVPNKEIREIFYRYMENNQNDSLSAFLNYSKEALAAVLDAKQERVAKLVQKVHDDFISSIEYNDENSLSCTVMIVLLASFLYYQKPIREYPCGKGFADLVYLPLPQCPQRPVIIMELKWNHSAATAITQIKEKCYPDSLKAYYGEILLVGISYEKKTKEHTCVIERVERSCRQGVDERERI